MLSFRHRAQNAYNEHTHQVQGYTYTPPPALSFAAQPFYDTMRISE